MKITALATAIVLSILINTPASWSSGYFPPDVSFVNQYQPDPPLDQFAAGRLGLILPQWENTYLYVAYRYLNGPGFDANEQKVLSVWAENPLPQPDTQPQADWIAARAKIPGAADLEPFEDFATTKGYESYRNCHDDAYRTATATLQSMVARFGDFSQQVKDWLDAQDLVFQNCPGSKDKPIIPAPLKGCTPLEQAERAYQIACANFYSENFDAAAGMFNAIAGDSTSPWRTIAPYLAARTTIRKATLSAEKNDPALLAQAEKQLNAVVAGSSPNGLKDSAKGLLNFVRCRLDPEESNTAEVRAIMRPGSESTLAQDLKNYRECGTPGRKGDYFVDDLDDWMSSIKSPPGDPSHAIDKWKATGSPAWLVASIAAASGSDPHADELMTAGERIEATSPAYVTAQFHIDRILIEQGKTDLARTQLDSILAKPDVLTPSASNQFIAMRFKLARNLDEYLKYALRYPASIEEVYPDEFNSPYMEKFAPGPLDELQRQAATQLLDADSVEVLNDWMPLSMLTQIARSPILPQPERARVARSVWVRSIVLGDRKTARELAPIVSELNPTLKPSLDSWLAAKSDQEKSFEEVLIMLRNPGMRPYLERGLGRITPFDKMDPFRDDWWGAVEPPAKPTPVAGSPVPAAQASVAKYPNFLSDAEKRSSDNEWARLSTIDAPEILCSAALRYADVNRTDERVPEALERCVGAVHMGPSSSRCDALAASAFHLLQSRYGDSKWAQQQKFWYRAGGSPEQRER